MIIILILIGAVFLLAAVTSSLQLASFFINYFGSEAITGLDRSFWVTENPWAWGGFFLMLVTLGLSVKGVTALLNRLIVKVLVGRGPLTADLLKRVNSAGWVLTASWAVVSFLAGLAAFNWLSTFPQFTEWFVSGNNLAAFMLMLTVFLWADRHKLKGDS